jgi:hypothetical protein
MSDPSAIVLDMMIECPRHEGNFDCTPFCNICEGDQEYNAFEYNPCEYCKIPVQADIWEEEMHMCIDCSHAYFDHNREYFLQFGIEVSW